MDKTVKIKIETEGLDETTEKIETMSDAMNGFPSQVSFKYLKDCAINIYPSQTKIVEVKDEDD